jgi:hypothetical protein
MLSLGQVRFAPRKRTSISGSRHVRLVPLAEVFDFVRAALSALIGTGVDGSPVGHA